MKKIILGMCQTTLSPFIIILGYSLIKSFEVTDSVLTASCIFGTISISFNFVMGCLLIVRGYQDEKTFNGW